MLHFQNQNCECVSAHNKVVSETLLVKEIGVIPKEKLAKKFYLQLPGWCPCLNCRDFDHFICGQQPKSTRKLWWYNKKTSWYNKKTI